MPDDVKPWRWSGAFGQLVDDLKHEPVLWADGSDINCSGETAALIAAAPAMHALLKELEWSGDETCPCCRHDGQTEGHAPDCRLAAILKEVEDAQTPRT